MKTLDVKLAITDALAMGIKNAPSIVGCVVLWLLTLWIPYINVGTTIAISSLPIMLAKGEVINPLTIFSAVYRKKMGDYIILSAVMTMALLTAMCFVFVPAIVLGMAWSMAVYVMLTFDKNPFEALRISNNITYGSKWKIFGTQLSVMLLIYIVYIIIGIILGLIAEWLFFIATIAFVLLSLSISVSIAGAIWKQLKENVSLSE